MDGQPMSVATMTSLVDDAIAEGDWGKVLDLTEDILQQAPDHPTATVLHATALGQLRKQDGPEVERRFLTVMFIDLVGSTRISKSLDPEDFVELLTAYQRIVRSAVESFGGWVAKLAGDGVIIYFGYPHGLEDAPRRACLAALQVVADLGRAADRLEERFGEAIRCRIGIDSGTAVVGRMGSAGASVSADIVGDVPNVAAHLQSNAEPGGVVISRATEELVHGLFRLEPVDVSPKPGIPVDMRAFRLLGVGDIGSGVRRATGFPTATVGRAQERQSLRTAWERARAGTGSLVALVGDAGMGKSHLVQQLHAEVDEGPTQWIEGGASEFLAARPFHLFIDAVTRRLHERGIDRSDPEAVAAYLGAPSAHIGTLIAEGVGRTEDPDLSPAQFRRAVITAVVSWIAGMTDSGPVVLALEDLHWADPSSLELLGELADVVGAHPLLVLATTRTMTPLRGLRGALCLTLTPLTPEETRLLAASIAVSAGLTLDVGDVVLGRAGGIPLFVQEMVRSMQADPAAYADHRLLPQTLRDLLSARLDSLGRPKRAAQVASVFGRSFSPTSVEELDPGHREMSAWLQDLVAAGILEADAEGDGDRLRFGHSLVQDAAYESLLRSERRTLHARAAAALARLEPNISRESPELIAHHLTEAGDHEPAVRAWIEAGELAVSRSASQEAVSHLRRAEALVADIDDDRTRNELDYEVQVALASPLTAVHGYAAREVEGAYERAARLVADSGDSRRRFVATRGLASTRLLRAEIGDAQLLGQAALEIAEGIGDDELILEARTWLGTTEFFAARMDRAGTLLEEVVAVYDVKRHGRHGFRFGIDPLVLTDSHRSWLHQLEGRTEEALALALRTLEHAESLQHRLSVAHALNYLAGLHQMRNEPDDQLAVARRVVSIAQENGFTHYIHYGAILLAHARSQLGDTGAVAAMSDALEARLAAGASLARPYHLYLRADGELRLGGREAAAQHLQQARQVARRTGEVWWMPTISRAIADLDPPGNGFG